MLGGHLRSLEVPSPIKEVRPSERQNHYSYLLLGTYVLMFQKKEKLEMSRRVLRSLFQILFVLIRQLGPSSNADVSLVVMSIMKLFPQPILPDAVVIASEMIRGVLWSVHKSFDCLPMNPTFIAATVALVNDFKVFQGPYYFIQVLEVSLSL